MSKKEKNQNNEVLWILVSLVSLVVVAISFAVVSTLGGNGSDDTELAASLAIIVVLVTAGLQALCLLKIRGWRKVIPIGGIVVAIAAVGLLYVGLLFSGYGSEY